MSSEDAPPGASQSIVVSPPPAVLTSGGTRKQQEAGVPGLCAGRQCTPLLLTNRDLGSLEQLGPTWYLLVQGGLGMSKGTGRPQEAAESGILVF